MCKPLLADYIAYAIAPLGLCYLLPVIQLQSVWKQHGEQWLCEAEDQDNRSRWIIVAENECDRTGRRWTTLSVAVTPEELFPKIGNCLRQHFPAFEWNDDRPNQNTRTDAQRHSTPT